MWHHVAVQPFTAHPAVPMRGPLPVEERIHEVGYGDPFAMPFGHVLGIEERAVFLGIVLHDRAGVVDQGLVRFVPVNGIREWQFVRDDPRGDVQIECTPTNCAHGLIFFNPEGQLCPVPLLAQVILRALCPM